MAGIKLKVLPNKPGATGAKGDKGDKGDQGIQGIQGVKGDHGESWFTGAGAPVTVVGAVSGDWYLDSATGNYYELVGASWTLRGNLLGPPGPAGATGPGTGNVMGPAGAGNDNIAVYNLATGTVIKDGGKKISDLALVTDLAGKVSKTGDTMSGPLSISSTIAATGTATFGPGGTSGARYDVIINSPDFASAGAVLTLTKNLVGAKTWYLGHGSGLSLGAGNDDLTLYSGAIGNIATWNISSGRLTLSYGLTVAGSSTFNGNVQLNPTSGIGGVQVSGPAGASTTFDVVAPVGQSGYLRFGPAAVFVEHQADPSGNYTINHGGGASAVFKSVRAGAIANTLVLDSGTATFNAGFSYFGYNAGATYPVSGGSLAVGWNFSGGLGEADFWNTYVSTPAGTQFRFYGKTGASTANLLLEIGGSAVGLVAPLGLTVSGVPTYGNIPQNAQSAAYTLVLTDAQKHILHPAADTTARTFTIPANSSVAYPVGTAITFVNQNAAGVVTIAITTDTMRLAGAGTTGNRTLAANGIATALKITATEWIISGTGLT